MPGALFLTTSGCKVSLKRVDVGGPIQVLDCIDVLFIARSLPGSVSYTGTILAAMPLQKPRFKGHLEFRAIAEDVVFVREQDHFEVLTGKLYPLLIPFIDGRNTREEIASLIGERVTVLDVQFGLDELEQSGYLVEAAHSEPVTAEDCFREALGAGSLGFKERIAATRAAVYSLCGIDPAPLMSALEVLGMRRAGTSVSDATIDILIVATYFDSRIDACAAAARSAGRPLFLVKPAGTTIWLGPALHPPRTPCWSCLAHRLREQPGCRIRRELEKRGMPFGETGDPYLPNTLHLACNLVATELWKWAIQGGQSTLDDVILSFDFRSLELEKHTVFRRHNCADCGCRTKTDDLPEPVRLRSRPKLFTADGGHRSVNPETVYATIARHVSPITGIVADVRAAGAIGPLHVYVATHNHEFGHRDHPAHWVVPYRSFGKGMTPAQARTGAVCEALERYSAVFQGDEFRRTASLDHLGDSAVHPNDCMLFSQSQYENRENRNRGAARTDWIPMRFDERRPIDWTALWSLTHQTFRWLPTAMCYFGYPTAPDHYFCRPDSNGLAAGSNLEEAVLQGYLELIERDTVAIWWYNRIRRPAVDLSSFRQPYFDRLLEHYESAGRDLWVVDLTGPFPVPVMAAVSARKPPKPADFLYGFGCHLDAGIAIARALTEVNQVLAAPGQQRDLRGDENGFLFPAPGEVRHRKDFPEYTSDDLLQDLEFLTELTAAKGLETLVLKQTRPGIGLDVARVIVPGLRPFYARFAPGRLYNVPLEIGWLRALSAETEMNRWPLVF